MGSSTIQLIKGLSNNKLDSIDIAPNYKNSMIKQSNSLRTLEGILTQALESGDRKKSSGDVLLNAMQLAHKPHQLVDLYELLNKAEQEAKSIRNKSNLSRYLQTIEYLQDLFITNHLWQQRWNELAVDIETKNIIIGLDALADFYHDQRPTIFIEQDFIDKLINQFEDILNQILASDLSKELKTFLTQRIEDLLRSLRRYSIEGTEGLEKASKLLLNDLIIADKKIKDSDKKSSVYQRIKSIVIASVLYLTPTPYDLIGVVPDINDFWIPKFEEFANGQRKIEQIVSNKQTAPLLESFEEASHIFDRQPQKAIAGKDIKALPPSKQDSEAATDNKIDE